MTFWDTARRDLTGLPQGGGVNIAHEAVDRHVAAGAGDREAFRFVGRDGAVRPLTYGKLAAASNRFANLLGRLDVAPGETVATLLGPVPELYVCALGTLKARACFTALFAVFGPEPIRIRLDIARARVLVTTAAAWRRKVRDLRDRLPHLRHVILVDGAPEDDTRSWPRLLADMPETYSIPPTDPEDPALIHFTSGTTGRPKGAMHVHDAVVAHLATARYALDLRPGDLYWCTADPGWVTGMSYGLIAPLVCGATALVVDGPFDAQRWCRLLGDHAVAVWYTSPTAIRMLRKAGAAPPGGCPSLRHAASVGEPLDAAAVAWGERTFGRPFHDTWWQTETGAIMIANPAGTPPEPGAMGRPLPGLETMVCRRDDTGDVEPIGEPEMTGELAIRAGWPSMFRDYIGEAERYSRCFAGGFYLSGDLVRRDSAGNFHFVGRDDDMIKSSGHRIGPFEVESVLLSHPDVAEVGVVGLPDPLLGEAVAAYVTPRAGAKPDDGLRRTLLAHARSHLGPAVAPRTITFASDLPKTKSGKILRRLLRSRALGLPEGDLSTLGEEGGNG